MLQFIFGKCGNAFRRRKSENFAVFTKIAIGGCAIGKVPHRQLFSRKGTEPVNNTRYTLDIVVCRYYERDQRFKRFLVKNANARRTGKAYPKPFVGCKRGFNGGIIAVKVKIIDKKLCFALGARSDNKRIVGLHNKHGAPANYAGERKGNFGIGQTAFVKQTRLHVHGVFDPTERLPAGAAFFKIKRFRAADNKHVFEIFELHMPIIRQNARKGKCLGENIQP